MLHLLVIIVMSLGLAPLPLFVPAATEAAQLATPTPNPSPTLAPTPPAPMPIAPTAPTTAIIPLPSGAAGQLVYSATFGDIVTWVLLLAICSLLILDVWKRGQ